MRGFPPIVRRVFLGAIRGTALVGVAFRLRPVCFSASHTKHVTMTAIVGFVSSSGREATYGTAAYCASNRTALKGVIS